MYQSIFIYHHLPKDHLVQSMENSRYAFQSWLFHREVGHHLQGPRENLHLSSGVWSARAGRSGRSGRSSGHAMAVCSWRVHPKCRIP